MPKTKDQKRREALLRMADQPGAHSVTLDPAITRAIATSGSSDEVLETIRKAERSRDRRTER